MSTTTAKIEKEIKQDVAAMESAISSLSYTQLAELLSTKKQQEIESVTHKLKEAEGIVEALKAQLVNLGVVLAPVSPAPIKRGRKPNKSKAGMFTKAKASKPTKAKKTAGKRGAVGEAITAFVASKGKAGAKVSEIAEHLGAKPANVTAFFYAKANRTKFKKVAPATFAAAK